MISISASFVTISEASTRTPSIFPATVAFAKPGPISDAISSIDRGFSNFLLDLSGRVISGIFSGDLH